MKNVQVIDGAENCSYSVYAFTDEEFEAVFQNGTDVEFIEDVIDRLGERASLLQATWVRLLDKKEINGIHGTLFYELREQKKKYYPTKKEAEMLT